MKSLKTTIYAFVIGIATLTIASCGVADRNYNDTVINMYAHYFNQMQSTVSDAGNSEDPATKKAEVDRLIKLSDSCTDVMNGLKPSEDAKQFHQSILDVISCVKNEFIPVYSKLISIENPEKNVDEFNKLVEEMNDLSGKLNDLETKAQQAQVEFASKSGMRIE